MEQIHDKSKFHFRLRYKRCKTINEEKYLIIEETNHFSKYL